MQIRRNKAGFAKQGSGLSGFFKTCATYSNQGNKTPKARQFFQRGIRKQKKHWSSTMGTRQLSEFKTEIKRLESYEQNFLISSSKHNGNPWKTGRWWASRLGHSQSTGGALWSRVWFLTLLIRLHLIMVGCSLHHNIWHDHTKITWA